LKFDESFINVDLPLPLSMEELYCYFEKMKLGDQNARDVIICHNIRLVIDEVAKKFSNTSYDLKELVSVGLIGLIKSVDTFDISKGFYFSTYAVRCIDNEILIFMRKSSKYFCDVSLDYSLTTDEDGNELKVEDILCDIDSDFVLEYENSESYQIIRKIVDELSDEDKNIIVKYFGFMNYPSMSQCEIANELGVSQGQVSRIIKRNLKKISVQLELQGIIEVSTRVCSTKQDCNATSKRLKTIYEYFYKYPREQIDVMLSKLNEEDKSLLFLRYGNDLDHPVPGEGWNREISKHFYNRLLPKMKKMLANPYYSSQNKRRVMKR